MRLSIIYIFLLFSTSTFAQSNSWNLKYFFLLDNPITLYTVNNTDPQGSSLSPTWNATNIIALEKNIDVGSKFTVLAGGGFGFFYTKINYVSSFAHNNNSTGSEISNVIYFPPIQFLAVYSGLAFSTSDKKQFSFNTQLRIGVFSMPLRTMDTRGKHWAFDGFLYRSQLEINYADRIYPMLLPEVNIQYQFNKRPIALSFGASVFYSPLSHLGGHVILSGQDQDYMEYLYDRMKAFGVSLGIAYVL